MTRTLMVPGCGGSGPEHWQTHWQRLDPRAEMVELGDWTGASLASLHERLDAAIRADSTPLVVVAHGLACGLLAYWALEGQHQVKSGYPLVVGLMMVAPTDLDVKEVRDLPAVASLSPMPLERLPLPTLVVASDDDPLLTLRRAAEFADGWGAALVEVGPLGHINHASNLGTWYRGRALLDSLLRTAPFSLDSRLQADTVLLGKSKMCLLLLMNETRYPWLILVPRRAGISEAFDLEQADRQRLEEESDAVASTLHSVFEADKVNVAALGNVVRQLHVHHVARFLGDPAWPAPVWGHSPRVPYTPAALERMRQRLRDSELAGWFDMSLSAATVPPRAR